MESSPQSPEAPDAPEAPRVRVIFAALMLALGLAALDQTIVGTALPTIVGDLGGLSHYSWVVTAYLLTSTISTPLHGKLGDLYGRKPLFQIAIVVFLVGSALCGLSQDMGQLIAFRALQGLGGGGLIVGAQALLGDVVSPRERGRYQGLFGAVFGVASVAGPLIGGFFVEYSSWRWVFYVNLPVGVIALATIATALHTRSEKVHHTIDYLGSALMAGGVGCLILLTTWGGNEYDWGSLQILGLAVVGVTLLALFVREEGRAAEPILPMRLFRNSIFTIACIIAFLAGLAMFGAVTYLPQYQQVVRGVSAMMSGVQLLPMMGGLLLTSIGSGRLISKFGRYRPYPIVGMAMTAIGLWLLSHLDVGTSTLTLGVFMFILGSGLGMITQTTVLVVQNAVDSRDLGTATSSATFFRSIGGSFGVALFGSIFTSTLNSKLAGVPGLSGSVTGSPDEVAQLPDAVRGPYLEAFADSLDKVFLYAAPIALVGFFVALFLKEIPLRSSAGAMDGVSESFGMTRVGAAHVIEEADLRVRAARAALGRLDQLTAGGGIAVEQVSGLRQVLEDRVAFFDQTVDRVKAAEGSMPPEGWAVLEELLQVEREALALRTGPDGNGSAHDHPEDVSDFEHEADVRIAATQAALDRLDTLAVERHLPDDRVACLRGLLQSRIATIREKAQSRIDHAAETPSSYWAAVVDVLETERAEIARLEASDAVTAPVAHRVQGDLTKELAVVT
jgi:EmrB/QacA subfamily drug resistance transporter